MFGATGHLPELIIILVIAVLILGPGKLPQVGGAVGKTIREFRKASTDADAEDAKEKDEAAPTTAAVKATPANAPTTITTVPASGAPVATTPSQKIES